MAVDPATLKTAAVAAKKAIGLLGSDEQGNSKLLLLIASITTGLIVLFAAIIYILNTPAGLIASFLGFTYTMATLKPNKLGSIHSPV